MILADAGPLVALLIAADQHHRRCSAALRKIHEPLATVWPAIIEAMYLLERWPRAQDELWARLENGVLQLLQVDEADYARMRELMHKYADRPMDLADAALVRVAERERIFTVFTVDRSDFEVYRPMGRRFRIVP